jgi:N-acetylmuramoyl-L-alanine amidase
VLKTLNCPGVLVEPAIISNDAEAKRVATPEFRQQIAEALFAGIRAYDGTLTGLRPRESGPAANLPPNPTSTPADSK